MVYIYKKTIGNNSYYYLRASVRKGNKTITKDIAYLGDDINKVKKKIQELPANYTKEIRKAYRTINRFIEANHYLDKIKSMKIKKNNYLTKETLENIEACRLHWNKVFLKSDEKTKQEIFMNFLVEFAFNTTSIEGNTIKLAEARKLLTENLTPKNKTLREIYDLKNTQKVFFDFINNAEKKLNHELICKTHDELLEGIDERKGYRRQDVRVFRMNFKSTPAPYVLTDMSLLIKWYNQNQNKLHPLVLAGLFHHKFEKIHPFMDGNGRTGRLLMNHILMSRGYPPLIVRNRQRQDYIRKLNKADKSELNSIEIENYKELVEFIAKEMIKSYWNIFL